MVISSGKSWLFAALVAVIALCSFVDGALAVYYIDSIYEYNPVADRLLKAGAAYFTAAKLCGLAAVVAVLFVLRSVRPKLAWPVAWAVAAFQVGLIVYQLVA